MTKVLNVSNGDYRIRVQNGGNIILDTLAGVPGSYGLVTILGSLDVQGVLTYIESTNTQISDNILQLNQGQTGNGISSVNNYVSGIEVERGNYSAAQLLFNEQVTHYDPITSTTVSGTWVLRTADGKLSGLQVSSIANSGTTDFVFDMQGSTNVVRVANASGGYENNINNDADLINKKYLTNYVAANNGVATVSSIYYPITAPYNAVVQTTSSSINFVINTQLEAQITGSGLQVSNVSIYRDTINNISIINPLSLTAATNHVAINAILDLDNQATDITTSLADHTQIYTKSAEGPGRTGIYFTNHTPYGALSYHNDELVSKNRAVLLSILL